MNMVVSGGINPSPARSTSESRVQWVHGGCAAVEAAGKPNDGHRDNYEVIRRIREAEKAEKIMHLICWGPTK